MVEVAVADACTTGVRAVARPVAADGSAVSPAGRRLELAAGPGVAEGLARLGDLPVGSAVITGAGALPVDYLIHVVIRSEDEPVTVAGIQRGLLNALRRADEWAVDAVALLPLGTGAGNLDTERAAQAMVSVIRDHERSADADFRLVIAVESAYEGEVFTRELALAGLAPVPARPA